MKRTYDASIGGTVFHVEEDAYVTLQQYLESVRTYFAHYPDNGDIVTDIESRIAEQCAQRTSASRLVTRVDAEHVIDVMGRVDQFGDPDAPSLEHRPSAGAGKRHLLRDPNDTIIAGVVSGIAQYFGIAPNRARMFLLLPVAVTAIAVLCFWLDIGSELFIVPAIFGFVIFVIVTAIYLLVWLLAPLAKTTIDKLRMRGDPVTLTSVEKQVRMGSTASVANMATPMIAMMSAVGAAVRTLVIGAVWTIGSAIVAGASLITIGVTVYLMMALSDPAVSGPTAMLASSKALGAAYFPFVVCSYLLTVIPLILIGMIIVAEFLKRRTDGWKRPAPSVYLTAMIVWMVVLMIWAWLWGGVVAEQRRQPLSANTTTDMITSTITPNSAMTIIVDTGIANLVPPIRFAA